MDDLRKPNDLNQGTSGCKHASKTTEDDPLARFPQFSDQVLARLEAGRQEYGDRSFSRPSSELVDELEEELLDILGWSYVLWTRIHKLREGLARVEPPPTKED